MYSAMNAPQKAEETLRTLERTERRVDSIIEHLRAAAAPQTAVPAIR